MSGVLKNLGDPFNGEESQLALIDLSEKENFFLCIKFCFSEWSKLENGNKKQR